MKEVITINRDDAYRACADAIMEFADQLRNSKDHAEFNIDFYAMKMMEMSAFSAMVISKLFEEEEG